MMDKITTRLWTVLGQLVGLPKRVRQFSITLSVDKPPTVSCRYFVDDLSDDDSQRMVAWEEIRSFKVVPLEEPYVSIQSDEERHPVLPTINLAPLKEE